MLRAAHAVARMRGLSVRHRRLRLALADAVLFVRSRALPLFYQRCACDWSAQELRFGRFTVRCRRCAAWRRRPARQEFVLHTADGRAREAAYGCACRRPPTTTRGGSHALQQLVLLHARDGDDARASPAPPCRRRDGSTEATPAHRRGGSTGGGGSSSNLAREASWPNDLEMKTRRRTTRCRCRRRRQPPRVGRRRRRLVGVAPPLQVCACTVQSWGCTVADCYRACLPPPPRPAGPAPPRTSNGMRVVMAVLFVVRTGPHPPAPRHTPRPAPTR